MKFKHLNLTFKRVPNSCNFSLIAPKIAINSKTNDTYCNDDHYYCSIYEVGFLLKNNGKGIYLSVALTFYIFL